MLLQSYQSYKSIFSFGIKEQMDFLFLFQDSESQGCSSACFLTFSESYLLRVVPEFYTLIHHTALLISFLSMDEQDWAQNVRATLLEGVIRGSVFLNPKSMFSLRLFPPCILQSCPTSNRDLGHDLEDSIRINSGGIHLHKLFTRLRQEDFNSQASLGYRVRTCVKIEKKKGTGA